MLFIFLGRSGSGKTTIANMIAKNYSKYSQSWTVVDVDDFWVADDRMPRVMYNGESRKLYDSIESINWTAVGNALVDAYTKFDHVILTTFVFTPEILKLSGWCIIEFHISENTCIERRQMSKSALTRKPVDEKWFTYDEWMVKEHVTPFYELWSNKLRKSHPHDYVGAELPLEIVYNLVANTIQAYLPTVKKMKK